MELVEIDRDRVIEAVHPSFVYVAELVVVGNWMVDTDLAWVAEVDNDMFVEVLLIAVELVDLVEHYNLLVLVHQSVAVVVVSKQSMGMVLVVDAAVAWVPLVVELVAVVVAYHKHLVAVVSSFVTVEVLVVQVELDSLYVGSPSRNYYTSSVHLWMDHMMVAFHYRLYRTDAWAFASVDTVVVVVDDPFDVDVHAEVDNHGKGLA